MACIANMREGRYLSPDPNVELTLDRFNNSPFTFLCYAAEFSRSGIWETNRLLKGRRLWAHDSV